MNNSGLNKTTKKRVPVRVPARGGSVSRSPSPASGGNKGFSFGKPKPTTTPGTQKTHQYLRKGAGQARSQSRSISPKIRSQSRSPDRTNPQKKVSKVKKDLYDHIARGRASQSPSRGHSSGVKRPQSQSPAASGDESGEKTQKSYPRKKKVLGGRSEGPGEKPSEDDRSRRSQDTKSGDPIPEVSEAEEEDGDDQEQKDAPKKKGALGRRLRKSDGQVSGGEVQQEGEDSKPDDQEGRVDGEGTEAKKKKPREKLGPARKVTITRPGVKQDASGDVVMGDGGDVKPEDNPNEADIDALLGASVMPFNPPRPPKKPKPTVGDRKEAEGTEVLGGGEAGDGGDAGDEDDNDDGSEGAEGQNPGGSKIPKKVKPRRLSEEAEASEAEEKDGSEAEEEDESLESAAERRKRLQNGETVPTKDIKPELRTVNDAIAAAIALQRRNGVMVVSEAVKKAIAAAATEEQRSIWPDIALGTFQVLFLLGKVAFVMFANGDVTSIDDATGGGLGMLADGIQDLATDAAKNRARATQRRRSLVEQGYEEMSKLTGKPKKEEEKVEPERKPKTQAELDEAKRIAELVRAHPSGKKPPTDDEVAEAKRIRDAKRAGTITKADYDSMAELMAKHSASGKKPTGEELQKHNQPEEEKKKELEKFKTIVALKIKEELDK